MFCIHFGLSLPPKREGMIVCIAEKPSVARDIAQVLGARERKDGYIEGNGYQVTWTFGHLCTLKEPQDYTDAWKSWNLGSLPMVPPRFGIKLISNPTYEKQFHIIEGLMQKADMIINCGDAGQEGELIQRWVMQKAGAKCPVKRLWISSLTEESIREGFNQLHEASDYQSLYEAGLSRAIGDWLLGMNATRLYTIKYGQNRQVLSIGRVQTPTLALIVNRQQEIENFVPRQYWELKTTYRDTLFNAVVKKSDEELIAEAEKNKKDDEPIDISKIDNPGMEPIANEADGLALVNRIKDLPFEVTDVTKKAGKEYPPRLYDLTSLQVDCNKKFGFSADDTLKLIQSLYEKKVTTYPRVDTTFLSDDIYPKCPNILRGLKGYEALTAPLLGGTGTTDNSPSHIEGVPRRGGGVLLPKSKKVFDNSKVTDHHAIIPTGQPPVNLTDQEKKVFDLVARHFIAVFYPECKISTTTIEGKVDTIPFKTSGRQVIDPGWRVVFKGETDDDSAGNNSQSSIVNCQFKKGEQGPHIPELQEKWTQPPRPYTEASLLRAMETAGKFVDNDELRDAMKENGIGRPSTRAAIIETLFKRNYIRKERKTLIATPTGIELIGLIHEDLLKSAELTGRWEKKLREIEKKTYKAGQFLDELKQMVTEIVNAVLSDNTNRRITVVNPEEEKKKKKQTKAKAKPKTNGNPNPSIVTFRSSESRAMQASAMPSRDEIGAKLNGQSSMINGQLPPDDSIIGKPCPVCGKGHIIKGKAAYGCSEWKTGCSFRLPFKQ